MSTLYEKRVNPSYVEMDDEPVIKPGGILARRGLYRDGRIGADYAARVLARPDDDACVFCEPRLTEEQAITYRGDHFTAFAASHPYEFFGDYPTGSGGHELVVPSAHTDTPSQIDALTAGEITEYLVQRQQLHTATTFVRNEGNPSKSVQHVHYHSLSSDLDRVVTEHTYSWEEGVTQLTVETADTATDTISDDEVIAKTRHFAITRPERPFAPFDGQEVVAHQRVLLDPQDEVASAAIRRYLAVMETKTPPDQRFQTYTPPTASGQSSNRIEVMRLSLNPVYKLEFDRTEGGITELVFAKLSLATVARINQKRQAR